LPKRKQTTANSDKAERAVAPVRSFWSGTISFGLVSIPVDLLSAVRPRRTAMKLIDKDGHALGRQYRCSKEGKRLDNDDLIRGYETDDGKTIEITDKEFESAAPEMSRDIELRNFVPLEQIPPLYFNRPYFLAPAGRSAKAYHLLAATMERTDRVGIGSFVMRGREYLVAIVSDNGVLRADTLRYADEIRSAKAVGLPKTKKPPAKKVTAFAKAIDALTESKLDVSELEDREAAALQDLVESKRKDKNNVVHPRGLEAEDTEVDGAKIIDLMEVLKKSLSKNVTVTNAQGGPPISLAEHRERRKPSAKTSKKPNAQRQSARKRTSKKKAS
jgi:DNA end-binding protein Ku